MPHRWYFDTYYDIPFYIYMRQIDGAHNFLQQWNSNKNKKIPFNTQPEAWTRWINIMELIAHSYLFIYWKTHL